LFFLGCFWGFVRGHFTGHSLLLVLVLVLVAKNRG